MEGYMCPICGGSVRPRRVSVTCSKGGISLVFPNVEAEVCSGCGEEFYSIEDAKSWDAEFGKASQHGRQK